MTPLNVVISEVMWMGSDKSTADEWVEIAGVAPLIGSPAPSRSLSGWTLTIMKTTGESVIARFPYDAAIASGSYLVISNYTKEVSRLSIDPYLISTSMSLPNTKLLLRLRDASGALIDEVDDGVGNPFAGSNPSGNGPKASMERIDLNGLGNNPANWRTATESRGFDHGAPIFGTPSSTNANPEDSQVLVSSQSSTSSPSSQSSSLSSILSSTQSLVSSSVSSNFIDQNSSSSIQFQPLSKLQINELLPNPKGADTAEWIEIKNTGSGAGNLSGMTLRTVGTAHRIRTGVAIPIAPGGIVVLGKGGISFSLSNNGSVVQLESGSIVSDTFSYGPTVEGASMGRAADGSIVPFCIPSPGQENKSLPLDPSISIDSGKVSGGAPVTLNLSVKVQTGSLTGSTCHFDFGDGYSTDSCNPSSHTIRVIGDYSVRLQLHDYCGNTVQRTLTGSVVDTSYNVHSKVLIKNTAVESSCTPRTFSGAEVTEFVPNPTGDESEGEWIEIHNKTPEVFPLCGWSLDDQQGGSKPYSLSNFQLTPNAYLVFPRKQTGITLNNDHDVVRLISPLAKGGTGVSMSVMFDNAPDDQSYATDGSGSWKWTSYLTPGTENRFQDVSHLFDPSQVIISGALPNPKGVDTYDEWIELTNTAGWPIWLNGWHIRDDKGKEFDLTGTVLSKVQTLRIPLYRKKYVLGNESDTLSLVDQNNITRSILSWENAAEGIIQRPYTPYEKPQIATVVQVIDGDTIVVEVDSDISKKPVHIRLLGIDAPEIHDTNSAVTAEGIIAKDYIRALLLNKKVELQFDTQKQDKYGRTLAYVLVDGVDVQQKLLTGGLAYAYRVFSVQRLQEYKAYEDLARNAKAGIWDNDELTKYYDAKIAEQDSWRQMREHGVSIKTDIPEGLVTSGATVHITSSPYAQLYMSANGGRYQPFTGGVLLSSNQTIRAYAVAQLIDDSEILKSVQIEKTYLVADNTPAVGFIRISEVYPSPKKGENEWIELENTSDEQVSLAGWKLDDALKGGSKVVTLQADAIIPPHGYLIFPSSLTHLSLSNKGDEVNLLSPSGEIMDFMKYDSVKKGESFALQSDTNTYCITQKPTPLEPTVCFIQIKKSIHIKSSKSAIKSKLKKINVKKKKVSKATLKSQKYAESQSGVYAGLEAQIVGASQSGNAKRLAFESTSGMSVVLFLGVLSVAAWIFRKKYGLFISYFSR